MPCPGFDSGRSILDESLAANVAPEAIAEKLFEEARSAGARAFCEPEALDALLARAEFAARTFPETGALVPAAGLIEQALRELCQGRRSFAEIREAGLLAHLATTLGVGHRLQTLAPEAIVLPGGRRVQVHYEAGKPPWIASRLQDFFGLQAGPTLGGRVPLVLHLLAPNKNSVQVTTNLRGIPGSTLPKDTQGADAAVSSPLVAGESTNGIAAGPWRAPKGVTSMFHYFAYGSVLSLAHAREWSGSHGLDVAPFLAGEPARLDGYRLVFDVPSRFWSGLVANLHPDPSAFVEGVLFTLDDSARTAVLKKEGVATGLYREVIEEVTVGARREKASVYVAEESRRTSPGPASRATLTACGRARGNAGCQRLGRRCWHRPHEMTGSHHPRASRWA